MLTDEKILITGPTGRIGFGLARCLARDNEVWGIARFENPEHREEMERIGVIPYPLDLYGDNFGDLPRDFTYLIHLAAALEDDYDRMLRVNGEGTGLLLNHCRNARAALVMSTISVYKPQPDPYFPYSETDPVGESTTNAPAPYSLSKISQEVVARYCARAFNLPVTIARMNAAYGPRGGRPVWDMQNIISGRPIITRGDPFPYTPILDEDIATQIEPLLAAASVPATIVNWGGDEVVTVQEWASYLGDLIGLPADVHIEKVSGWPGGVVSDNTKRLSITGPSRICWKQGLKRTMQILYPDRCL